MILEDCCDFSALRPSGGGSHRVLMSWPLWRAAGNLCVAAFLLSGCFTSGPPGNLGFSDIEHLSDLDGVYGNLGEGESGELRLSNLVWPDAEGLDHPRIDRIEVRAIASDTLTVTATDKSNGVIKSANFVEGEDFKISDGVIQLSRRMIAPPLDAEAITHFLGLGYEDVDIGLDQAGHGKYRSKGVAGGLVFMWFPIAAGGSDDVRFRRLSE